MHRWIAPVLRSLTARGSTVARPYAKVPHPRRADRLVLTELERRDLLSVVDVVPHASDTIFYRADKPLGPDYGGGQGYAALCIGMGDQPTDGSTATVDWTTQNGTALSKRDYVQTSGTVTLTPSLQLPAGSPYQVYVFIPLINIPAPDEYFYIHLSNPTGEATLSQTDFKVRIRSGSQPPPPPVAAPVENGRPNATIDPIRYGDGMVTVPATDLSSDGFGGPWGQARTWASNPFYSQGSDNGNGWSDDDLPTVVQTATGIDVIRGGGATSYDGQGTPDAAGTYSTYTPTFPDPGVHPITYDATDDLFVVPDATGGVYRFYGFEQDRAPAQYGALASWTDPDGNATAVVSADSTGRPTEIQRSAGSGGSAVAESYVYAYTTASGSVPSELGSVTLRRSYAGGSWQTALEVVYQYYDGTTGNGNAGDLERATLEDGTGAVLGVNYYRYYTSATFSGGVQVGYQGGLAYAFGPEAYARLEAAEGSDAAVDAATGSAIAPYANVVFQYDSAQRATAETLAGAGASAGGGDGTYTYAYTASGNATGFNSWAVKTVETRADGTTDTVYTNSYMQVMLDVLAPTGVGEWERVGKWFGDGEWVGVGEWLWLRERNRVGHRKWDRVGGRARLDHVLPVRGRYGRRVGEWERVRVGQRERDEQWVRVGQRERVGEWGQLGDGL